ncbi:MAG: response regulator [Gemmatales bacterium]|nr:response regulator [Gemmatales bacterium]MDW7993419.1 response regulator [Gemmatales bacterium]
MASSREIGQHLQAVHPRILVLQSSPQTGPLLAQPGEVEYVYADSLPQAMALLKQGHVVGVLTDVRDINCLEQGEVFLQAHRILELLEDGVAVVDENWRIIWANSRFRSWCIGPADETRFYDALGSPEILGPEYSPFHAAWQQGRAVTCLRTNQGRFLEIVITPLDAPAGPGKQFLVLGRDVTHERQRQQKLDAIHQAGRELAALSPEQLARMTPAERIELLKQNILRYTHDLLHYDVIEVRLLDPRTGKLELLVAEGITPEAAQRELYARPQGNGITGFVASTGKSYLCPDTSHDPLYLEGARGARSSLTVPLLFQDRVVGTFNVESPKPNAFTEEDQQFLEIFCREIAQAIHTLELLVAEKRETVSQSLDLIRRDLALPLDAILIDAATLLERYIGHDDEVVEKLQRIQQHARLIQECLIRVGEVMTPAPAPAEVSNHPIRGLRVLVVDSEERVRRAAHSLLERFGCRVETARTGREALSLARLHTYDVIVADIRPPDYEDGFELCQQFRQIQPQTHIVLMTGFGYDARHTLIRSQQAGLIAGKLFKPFRVEQLLSLLESLPRRSSVPNERTQVPAV